MSRVEFEKNGPVLLSPAVKAVWEYPLWSSAQFGPLPLFEQESVGEDEEFSHDGDESDFAG